MRPPQYMDSEQLRKLTIILLRVGCGLVLTGSIYACRSMDARGLTAQISSTPERPITTTREPIAENCEFSKNRSAIPRFCHPITKTCESEIPENSIMRLSCRRVSLIDKDLSYRPLKYALLSGTDLTRANLTQADLSASHADYAKFHQIQAELTKFSFSILIGAEFIQAHLHHAKFISSFLLLAKFDQAHLTGAVFHSAELRKASFKNAYLKGASFELADLSQANFEGADLLGADFTHANIKGANFSNTKHIERTTGLPDEVIKAHRTDR